MKEDIKISGDFKNDVESQGQKPLIWINQEVFELYNCKCKTNWKELKDWLEDLINENNNKYELYKDDILHYEFEINNIKYQNNILLAILDKMQELENKK